MEPEDFKTLRAFLLKLKDDTEEYPSYETFIRRAAKYQLILSIEKYLEEYAYS